MKKKNPISTEPHDWPHFIIQSMADGVITVNEKLQVTDLNRAAEKLTGYLRGDALGHFCGEILHSSMCGKECPLKMAMVSGEAVSREAILHNRQGQKIEVMLTASALRDNQGNLLGGVETFRDIGPIKQMENERRQLVSMFAHDLKAPVVGVAGLLHRLIQGKLGELNSRQTDYIANIHREMQRLENLITNFLDYSRLDLHIITPVLSAIQVEKECQEAISLSQAQAEEKGIALKVEYPQDIIVLQADPMLFRRTLCNLIGNAIKYSPSQSTVTLKVRDKGEEVQFAIEDQGPGIDPQDLPHLFELLYRGKGSGQESGLGLGLAIVKRIVDAHGGRIWVKSKKGQGSSFFFTLPKRFQPE
jgi:PAS domain S-box-containing protein